MDELSSSEELVLEKVEPAMFDFASKFIRKSLFGNLRSRSRAEFPLVAGGCYWAICHSKYACKDPAIQRLAKLNFYSRFRRSMKDSDFESIKPMLNCIRDAIEAKPVLEDATTSVGIILRDRSVSGGETEIARGMELFVKTAVATEQLWKDMVKLYLGSY